MLGKRPRGFVGEDWIVASESLVLESAGYDFVRDVAPGEAIFIALDGEMTSRQCAKNPRLIPCSFEYVYLARPDSIMNGISVYEARLRLGNRLADTIAKYTPTGDIDVVMPIPDSSRPAAMQVAQKLGIEYREGFYKNRYVGRTFIMPGQAERKKSVKQKLNAMGSEFRGKNILIVDDSIVRGTTSKEIVQMAREAGANKVTFTSAAPPVRFPHVYGINMPSRQELVAHGRKIPEIATELGADYLIYQEVADMQAAIIEGSNVTVARDELLHGRVRDRHRYARVPRLGGAHPAQPSQTAALAARRRLSCRISCGSGCEVGGRLVLGWLIIDGERVDGRVLDDDALRPATRHPVEHDRDKGPD